MSEQHITLLDMSGISEHVRYTLDVHLPVKPMDYRLETYLNYLVEELRFALTDPEAESAFEIAARYLISMGVANSIAYKLSEDMMAGFIDLIGANFPHMTLLEMAKRTFVIYNYGTLAVRE